jgi:hypothetical protein
LQSDAAVPDPAENGKQMKLLRIWPDSGDDRYGFDVHVERDEE